LTSKTGQLGFEQRMCGGAIAVLAVVACARRDWPPAAALDAAALCGACCGGCDLRVVELPMGWRLA
jgi:hypothetical protein